MATIFDGIRALDVSQGMSGSLTTMLLADNGAEVIKVEPPGGDPHRSMPAWPMWNRGKTGIVLDLHSSEGQAQVRTLAGQMDVLVETLPPGTARAHGLDYETLAEANPGLVYCAITAMGSTGPYAGLPMDEGVVQAAAGGYVELQGMMHRATPTYRVRPMASYGSANLAVQGIASALRARLKTGLGQRIETSLFQGYSAFNFSSALPLQITRGLLSKPYEAGIRAGMLRKLNIPYLPVRCKDGQWLQMACMALRLFPNWMKAIGLEAIYDDPRFKGAPFIFEREEDAFALRDLILERMLERTLDEWMDIFTKQDVAADRFLTTQQFIDHPLLPHLQGSVEINDPALGATTQIGPLARFARTPSRIGVPAPQVGQHNDEVLGVAGGNGSGEQEATRPEPATGTSAIRGAGLRYPLEGMVVLDLATWLAAPVGTSLLADLGARVIKVEPPGGDEFRSTTQGRGRTFQGKESLVVDLKTEEGRGVLHLLVKKADALLHNMRGQAPERTGTDYETVRKINPDIIYLYAGSYGSTGPGAGRAAFHPIGGGMSGGALWQMGRDNQPPPADVPMSIEEIANYGSQLGRANEGSPDVTSAIAVGTALAMALYHKERTGEGQYLETSMMVSNAYICSEDFVRYEGKPARQEPDRHLRGLHALYRLYDTAEGWVFLACPTQAEWESFCRAAGAHQLASDQHFSTQDARREHDHRLTAGLAMLFMERTAEEWERDLRRHGVSCVRADRESYDEMFLTPAMKEAGFAVEVERPSTGRMTRQGPPVRFSRTPARAEAPHELGEDTPAILRELGLSEQEMADLRQQGVVLWPELAEAGQDRRDSA